jgi:hypothetical protein
MSYLQPAGKQTTLSWLPFDNLALTSVSRSPKSFCAWDFAHVFHFSTVVKFREDVLEENETTRSSVFSHYDKLVSLEGIQFLSVESINICAIFPTRFA